jgi:hypothetical protein
LAQYRLIAQICVLFKACTGGRAWKAIGERLQKPCYLSREDHNRKIRTRNKEHMLVNIPSEIGPLKAGKYYLQAYQLLSPVN